jgi:hypothetical protein
MADNKSKRGSRDRSKVAGKQKHEVDYLKKKYKVSGQQVAGAIRAVGNSRAKIEAYLKLKKKKK